MLLLGVLAAQAEAAAPAGGPAYDLLETEILTGSQASVTFSSLNSTYGADYQHLQIRWTGRSQVASNGDAGRMRINSDTGSNYYAHYLQGTGSAVQSGAASGDKMENVFAVNGNNDGASRYAAGVIDILDPFETTKNTTVRSFSGIEGNEDRVRLASGLWINTAAVTTIEVYPANGWVTGCRFSLYGLKASA